MRDLTEDEQGVVARFFDGLHPGLYEVLEAEHQYAIVEGESRQLVLASPDLFDLPAAVREGHDGAGLPIGNLYETKEGDRLGLDLQGATEVVKYTDAQVVRVREKAARLFLYGRDIIGDSILWHHRRIDRGDTVIVCDPRGDALGLAEVVGAWRGKRTCLAPLMDLGQYLRDQGLELDHPEDEQHPAPPPKGGRHKMAGRGKPTSNARKKLGDRKPSGDRKPPRKHPSKPSRGGKR